MSKSDSEVTSEKKKIIRLKAPKKEPKPLKKSMRPPKPKKEKKAPNPHNQLRHIIKKLPRCKLGNEMDDVIDKIIAEYQKILPTISDSKQRVESFIQLLNTKNNFHTLVDEKKVKEKEWQNHTKNALLLRNVTILSACIKDEFDRNRLNDLNLVSCVLYGLGDIKFAIGDLESSKKIKSILDEKNIPYDELNLRQLALKMGSQINMF
jgi:hypothetical protein